MALNNKVVIEYDFTSNLNAGIKEANQIMDKLELSPDLSEDMKKEIDLIKKAIKKNAKDIQTALDRITNVEISTKSIEDYQYKMQSSINSIISDINMLNSALNKVGVDSGLDKVAANMDEVAASATKTNESILAIIKSLKGSNLSLSIKTNYDVKEIQEIEKTLSGAISEYQKFFNQQKSPYSDKENEELLATLKEMDEVYSELFNDATSFEKKVGKLDINSEEYVVANAQLMAYKQQLRQLADEIDIIQGILEDRKIKNIDKLGDFALSPKSNKFLNNIEDDAIKAEEAIVDLLNKVNKVPEVVSEESLNGKQGAIKITAKISTDDETLYKQLVKKLIAVQDEVNKRAPIIVPVKLVLQGTPYGESKKDNLVKSVEDDVKRSTEEVVAEIDKVVDDIIKTISTKIRSEFKESNADIISDLKETISSKTFEVKAEISKDSLSKMEEQLQSDKLAGSLDLSKNVKKADSDIKDFTEKAEHLVSLMNNSIPDYSSFLDDIKQAISGLTQVENIIEDENTKLDNDGLIKIDISDLKKQFDRLVREIKSLKTELSSLLKEGNLSSLEGQWINIAKTFHSIADESGKIDLRKQKSAIEDLLGLYKQYVSLGGTNTFAALTDNASTLSKLQKISDKSFGGISVNANKSVKETRTDYSELLDVINNVYDKLQEIKRETSKIKISANQLESFKKLETALGNVATALSNVDSLSKDDVLGSLNTRKLSKIATILERLNTIKGSSSVFKRLKIDESDLDNLSSLAPILKKVADELKTLDSIEYVGFISQLKDISASATSLNNLATAIKSAKKSVKKELVGEPGNVIPKNSLSYVKKLENELDKLKAKSASFGEAYGIHLNELAQYVEEFNSIKDKEILSEDDLYRAAELISLMDELKQQIKTMPKLSSPANVSKMLLKMNKYLADNTKLTKEMKNSIRALISELEELGNNATTEDLKRIGVGFTNIQIEAIKAGKAGTTFLDAIKNKLKYGWAEAFARYFSLYDIVRYIREVSTTVTELNTNLIELAKVSEASIGELYSNFKDFRDIAKQTGATINEVITSTSDWARMGYSLQDAEKLSKVAQIYKAVGDNITSEQTTEYLISTLQGFEKNADEALHIVDVYNEVANNFAIDTQGIGEALERSAASFNAANTSLEQSVALVTTANTVLQNPEAVGTIFKTLSARIRGASSELEELGEEGVVTTAKLREMVKALTGFDIMRSENEFKSIYEILIGIGKEWENLSDVEQASLGEMLAGKRNANALYAILQNIDTLESAYATALDSEGSAMKEHEAYMSGVQAQIDLFVASAENLANTFMSSDFLISLIKTGTKLVDILDTIISDLGTIPTLLTTIATVGVVKFNLVGDAIRGAFNSTFTKYKAPWLPEDEVSSSLIVNKDTISPLLSSGTDEALEAVIQKFNDLNKGIIDADISLKDLKAQTQNTNPLLAKMMNVTEGNTISLKDYKKAARAAKIEQAAFNVVSGITQGIIMALASVAISKLVSAISDAIHATEKAIQAGKEAQETISDIRNEMQSMSELVENSSERFAELAQGVDSISGKNISLSDEDYKEFLNISNQLAETFPTLSRHYDENGNAIVDLNGDVNTITETLNELLETEKKLHAQEIADTLPTVYEGIIAQSSEYDKQIKQINKDIDETRGKLNAVEKDLKEGFKFTVSINEETRYENLLKALGLENGIDFHEIFDSASGRTTFQIHNGDLITDEMISQITSVYTNDLNNLERELNSVQNQQKSNWQSLTAPLSAWISTQDLSSDVENAMLSIVQNIDWQTLGKETDDEILSYLQDNFIRLFNSNPDLASRYSFYLGLETQFNNNEVTWGEYQSRIQAFLEFLQKLGLDEDTQKTFMLSLGLDFEDGKILNPNVQNLKEQFDKYGFEDISDDLVGGLTDDVIKELYDSAIDWSKVLNKDDSLTESIRKIQNEATRLSSTPFTINFNKSNIEQTTKGIQRFQEIYEDLWNANKEGKSGADLASTFSDIDKLLTESSKDANDAISLSKEAWNEFFTTMTDGTHTFEEMEDALNRAMTSYVLGAIDLQTFDEEQAKAISTQLQLAGVTKESADAFVSSMTEIAEANQALSDAHKDLETATYEDIDALVQEGTVSEEVAQQLMLLALKKQLANQNTIKTSADINNLLKLAEAANLSSDALVKLAKLKSSINKLELDIEDAKANGKSSAYIKNMQTILDGYVKRADEAAEKAKQDVEAALSSNIDLETDSSKVKDKSKSGGSSKDTWKEAYEKELAELDSLHERELISDIRYYEEREKLNDKYFKDREKYTKEYNDNLGDIYKGFKEAYKSYVDDMADYWEKSLEAGQISFKQYCENMTKMLNDLHDAGKIDDETYYSKMADFYASEIENYDKAVNAAQRLLKKQIDSLEKQKESIEKSYQEQIDSIQSEIDALKDANEERQKALDLQKALYDLNRAQNQRTQYTYTSDKGFVYKANEKDIKNAQEDVEQTQYEMYISTLEKKIETLETEMENLTSAIDDQIDKLQDYSDRLGEVANKWDEAQEDMVAASIWGANWQEDILNTSEELLRNFTKEYVDLEQQQADMAYAAVNKKVEAYNKEIEAINALKEAKQSEAKTSGVSKLNDYSIAPKDNNNGNRKKETKEEKRIETGFRNGKKYAKVVTYKYGKGTDNATPGYHEIAEDGDEIVLDNYGNAFVAKGHQLHRFEGGEKVFDETETKELLSGKYLPIESILPNYSDMLDKIIKSGTLASNYGVTTSTSGNKTFGTKTEVSNSINITVGDIHVTEVDNATELAKAITNKLPNALIQELNRK